VAHLIAFWLTMIRLTGNAGSACYPCLVLAESAPPGYHTRILHPRSWQLPVASFCSSRVGRDFSWIFSTFPHVVFTLRVPSDFADFTTPLSFCFGRCRPTACWVCTPPLFLSVKQNPLAATILRQDPAIALTFWVSLSPECRQLFSSRSRVPLPGFHLTVLRATRAR